MNIPCEICGTSCTGKKFNNKMSGHCTIYKCANCNLYFLKNIDFNNDNSINIDWDKRKKLDGGLKVLRQKNYKKILKTMNNFLEKGSTGLEVGSAYGWFLELANKDYTCCGIEADNENINIKERFKIYKGFFPNDLPTEVTDLDFIIFNDVFEHIPNCHKIMKQCYKLLKPGGILIINLPLSSGIFFKISSIFNKLNFKSDYSRMWQINSNSPHLYYFNKSNLIKLAKKSHFKFEHIDFLETIDRKSIYDRITIMNNERFSYLKSIILWLFYPILNLLPKDTAYFIFTK